MHNLGDSRFNAKDYDGAAAYYQNVLKVKPDDKEAIRKLGLVEDYKTGKIKDALTTYLDQIKSRPEDGKAWLNAGTEYFSRGKYKEAIGYFENALKRDPNLPEAWNNLGTSKGITGDPRGALRCFEKALAIKPNYAESMYNMGLAYGQLQDNNNALTYYRQAAKLGHGGAQKVLKDNGYSW
jgi:tetratricopeptide (TPR) repeat protein